MSVLDAKLILLFTLLGTALAFRTALSEAEGNLPLQDDLTEMKDEELELTLQQDTAQLMLAYAKIAEEHAEVYIYNDCYIICCTDASINMCPIHFQPHLIFIINVFL